VTRWKPGTNPGRLKAVVYAVLVHLALIGVLVAGWRWSTQDGTAPEKVVQAVAIQEPAQPEAPAARKRPEADTDKKDDERARKAAEDKKQAAEAEKRRSAAVKKKEALLRQKLAEQSLKEGLAAEERQRREARAAAEVEKYRELIRQKVSRNWNRPVGAARGLQCTVRVRVVPGGEVLQATVVRSSGDVLFDGSVESAVYKSTPLPLPDAPELFEYFRELEFLFRPEE